MQGIPRIVYLPEYKRWFVVLRSSSGEKLYELCCNWDKLSAQLQRADPPFDRLARERARQTQ